MDKKMIMQLAVIGIVLLFLLETVSIAFLGSHSSTKIEEKEGYVHANMKIINYAPYLFVQDASNITNISGIKEIQNNVTFFTIVAESPKDVPRIYYELNKKGIDAGALALVSIRDGYIILSNGTNTTFPASTYQFSLEPIYYQGDVIPVSFYAKISNGVSISNFQTLPQQEVVVLNASLKLYKQKYTYYVPWELRTANYSSFGNYIRKDYFVSNISKNISYIVSSSGQTKFVGNLTNKSLILKDFPDAEFPYSKLITEQPLNLSFNNSVSYEYIVEFPKDYEIDGKYYYFGEIISSYISDKNLTDALLAVKLTKDGFRVQSAEVIGLANKE